MNTLLLFAILHGVVSISPIRVFQPYPRVKCPHGYSIWWPGGKEFDNDKYAECIKPVERPAKKATRNLNPSGRVTSVAKRDRQ